MKAKKNKNIGWAEHFLSGNDNIHNEAHYFASNITSFFKNAEIVCSVDKYQLPSS